MASLSLRALRETLLFFDENGWKTAERDEGFWDLNCSASCEKNPVSKVYVVSDSSFMSNL